MRIKFVVSYDGTDFCGWATQTGQRTVQSTLKEAVRRISGEENEIFGASRTDSGAHARGQVCHFDTHVRIDPAKWPIILHSYLPPDLSVLRSREVPDEFHSRFCARDRFYRYRIQIGAADPLRSRFTYRYHSPLSQEKMVIAGQSLVGDHDFRAFTEELDDHVENTRRIIYSLSVRFVRDEVWVDVVGTAFLRGMMRRIAGALFEVGRGYRPVEEVSRLLRDEERDQIQWPVVLPAKGLCLMRVRYDRKLRDIRTANREEDLEAIRN